jgi:type III secretion protein L
VSAVIARADAGGAVRPFGPAPAPSPGAPAAAPAEDPLAVENARLSKALEAANAAAALAEKRGRAEGRREGAAAAVAEDGERLELLEKAMAAAAADLAGRLEGIDALALAIARAALAKVFEDPAGEAERVAAAIVAQVSRLRSEAVLAVHVSRADFPDEAALAALPVGAVRVAASAELASGECRLDLVLGQADIGPRTQWARGEAAPVPRAPRRSGPRAALRLRSPRGAGRRGGDGPGAGARRAVRHHLRRRRDGGRRNHGGR